MKKLPKLPKIKGLTDFIDQFSRTEQQVRILLRKHDRLPCRISVGSRGYHVDVTPLGILSDRVGSYVTQSELSFQSHALLQIRHALQSIAYGGPVRKSVGWDYVEMFSINTNGLGGDLDETSTCKITLHVAG